MTKKHRKGRGGGLVALLLGCFVAVGLAEGASRIALPNWSEFSSNNFMQVTRPAGEPSLLLGRPGFDGWFAQNNGDFRVRIRINPFGLRSALPPQAAEGTLWAVGDSFTFGWGVAEDEAYGRVAGSLAGMAGYLVASPGADLCNYRTLIARMPARPAAVIVGLTLENDVLEYDCTPRPVESGGGLSLSGAKDWLLQNSALYNLFAVVLKRQPAILGALAAAGIVATPHALDGGPPGEKAIAATIEAALRVRQAAPPGTPFAMMIIPTRLEVRDGDAAASGVRQQLVEGLQKHGITVIDVTDDLRRAGFDQVHFKHDGHWTPKGHRIAAERIAGWLPQYQKEKARP